MQKERLMQTMKNTVVLLCTSIAAGGRCVTSHMNNMCYYVGNRYSLGGSVSTTLIATTIPSNNHYSGSASLARSDSWTIQICTHVTLKAVSSYTGV